MLIDPFMKLCWALTILYTFCEAGERIKLAFCEIDDKVNQLKWYSFPTHLWRMLPVIMANTQETVNLKCFGSISCGLIAFEQVKLHAKKRTELFKYF